MNNDTRPDLVTTWRGSRDALARLSGRHLARARSLMLAVQPGDVGVAAAASVQYAQHAHHRGAARALDTAAAQLEDERCP